MRLANPVMFVLTLVSKNRKTGPMATVRSSKNSCPDSCKWKMKNNGGCYGNGFPILRWWNLVPSMGVEVAEVANQLLSLPSRYFVRLFEVGDLPGDGKRRLYKQACLTLAKACRKLQAFGYSHYPPTKHNLPIFREMNKHCTINLSADNPWQAVKYFTETELPVVCTVPSDSPDSFTCEDILFVKCLHDSGVAANCYTCGGPKGPLCLRKNRNYVITFPAHGNGTKKINEALSNVEFVGVMG